MLIFTYKLEKYVKKNLIPKILLNPNKYLIKGSFRRRIPYVTDIDIVNDVYPEINENNIYDELVKLIKKIKNEPNIILINITCGNDERFRIKNGSNEELENIRDLLDTNEITEFDIIMEKFKNDQDKKIFYINEMIWKYYRLRWKPNEILDNKKVLSGNMIIKFTDIIKENTVLLLQYYIKIESYPIGVDVIVNYKKPINMESAYSAITDYQIKLANYSNEYYYMLFPLRAYFRDNKKIHHELEELIEKKFGLYKQLMVRIDTYHILYDTNNLDIRTATSIVASLIRDIKNLPQFTTNTINKIKEVSENNPPDIKMKEWSTLLNVLYDDINMAASIAAKEYFFRYLDMVPQNIRHKYYLQNEQQNRINKEILKIY
ncbi:hypothetical protein QJ856_gp1063 [Tupanvirus deep ocean]|uniref:Uncharacterized protein n=2 Tax=Tupanvirus TaxID=2094720 RepID=A0AC62A7J7_9VIRU|nr:hypothetical protein QJ856_gp1063 [Tupanvirus deep ocean]QKU33694.1 hypothetical protein [Tupanvirus deep ocean]